ncbi:hypothetical protein SSX86_013044 [Deinandra increscens subsp. villosa]|uniref:Potassium channel domain-containing protein n=1 Tax=Deinandra increscens subsp. villosa TaxID=3103831 RepID=A0AAP0D9L7_9ASTR
MADHDTKDALLKKGKVCKDPSVFYPPPSISNTQVSLKQMSVILAAYLTMGTVCFSLIQDQISGEKTNKILDAIYFCVITMTAAGYGDVGPETRLAKSLACIFVFTGLALGGLVLSKAADYIVERQEMLLVKAIHMHETYGPNDKLKEAATNKAKYKFLTVLTLILFLMTLGTLFLALVEKLSYFEAFYCVCATITTLGRRVLVHWALNRKLTIQDLENADLDDDKVVSAAEYIVYKLREMGKVSNEDIAVVVEGFKNLDVDCSGTLTVNDLKIIESFEAQC